MRAKGELRLWDGGGQVLVRAKFLRRLIKTSTAPTSWGTTPTTCSGWALRATNSSKRAMPSPLQGPDAARAVPEAPAFGDDWPSLPCSSKIETAVILRTWANSLASPVAVGGARTCRVHVARTTAKPSRSCARKRRRQDRGWCQAGLRDDPRRFVIIGDDSGPKSSTGYKDFRREAPSSLERFCVLVDDWCRHHADLRLAAPAIARDSGRASRARARPRTTLRNGAFDL